MRNNAVQQKPGLSLADSRSRTACEMHDCSRRSLAHPGLFWGSGLPRLRPASFLGFADPTVELGWVSRLPIGTATEHSATTRLTKDAPPAPPRSSCPPARGTAPGGVLAATAAWKGGRFRGRTGAVCSKNPKACLLSLWSLPAGIATTLGSTPRACSLSGGGGQHVAIQRQTRPQLCIQLSYNTQGA